MISIKHCSIHRKSSFMSRVFITIISFQFHFPNIVNSGIFTVFVLRMTVFYLQPVERDQKKKKKIEEMLKPCSLLYIDLIQ